MLNKILYVKSDYVSLVFDNIHRDYLYKLILVNKNLYLSFKEFFIYDKYLTLFYRNKIKDMIINDINPKINQIFKNNYNIFTFINNKNLNLRHTNDELYNYYQSNYIIGKDLDNNIFLFIRFVNNTYIGFYHINNENLQQFYYRNSPLCNTSELFRNHTFTCGCSNMFTCSNKYIIETRKKLLPLLMN